MIFPEKNQYMNDSKQYSVIPVFTEIEADLETPLSLFLKVNGIFLLESIEQGQNVGRYSIIALDKAYQIIIQDHLIDIEAFKSGHPVNKEHYELPNPLNKVRDFLNKFKAPNYSNLPPFFGGLIGYLGYETVRFFENIPLHQNKADIPDAIMLVPKTILVYDAVKRSVMIIVTCFSGDSPEVEYNTALEIIKMTKSLFCKPVPYIPSESMSGSDANIYFHTTAEEYIKKVKNCMHYIKNGDIIQAVLSQKFSIKTKALPIELYRKLRISNPSPYLFYLNFDSFSLVGSSPEVMVRVQNHELLLKPIAGTRPRGKSLVEDKHFAQSLLEDPKEKAEHIMLVDLGRNDLGRVAVPGSVEVSEYMSIEKYSHVMHIVSTIKAELDKKYDMFDVIKATFPAGTLTGAPKIRAMEIITELEPEKRGAYGGIIFNMGFNGNMDSCITIRTMIIKNHSATIQTGAGIVYDSIPEYEHEECLNKAKALFSLFSVQDQKESI